MARSTLSAPRGSRGTSTAGPARARTRVAHRLRRGHERAHAAADRARAEERHDGDGDDDEREQDEEPIARRQQRAHVGALRHGDTDQPVLRAALRDRAQRHEGRLAARDDAPRALAARLRPGERRGDARREHGGHDAQVAVLLVGLARLVDEHVGIAAVEPRDEPPRAVADVHVVPFAGHAVAEPVDRVAQDAGAEHAHEAVAAAEDGLLHGHRLAPPRAGGGIVELGVREIAPDGPALELLVGGRAKGVVARRISGGVRLERRHGARAQHRLRVAPGGHLPAPVAGEGHRAVVLVAPELARRQRQVGEARAGQHLGEQPAAQRGLVAIVDGAEREGLLEVADRALGRAQLALDVGGDARGHEIALRLPRARDRLARRAHGEQQHEGGERRQGAEREREEPRQREHPARYRNLGRA